MYTLAEIARQFNRDVIYVRGLQTRFGVAEIEGSGYSKAYAAWFRTVIHLRMLGISENALVKLWNLEKKLLQLLHHDAVDSPTWYLDSCGKKLHRHRRLLLTNYDLGINLFSKKLQLGMNFHARPIELFKGADMGEDAYKVFDLYLQQYKIVVAEVHRESRHLASAAGWGRMLRAE